MTCHGNPGGSRCPRPATEEGNWPDLCENCASDAEELERLEGYDGYEEWYERGDDNL